ncbi:MAG TPA: CAP domain-containing protein [Polyangiaceae bacterium]|jgi:uncharacterized protein YkwD|nr:CAP domain-containing protein [Polyangiaceae bacterium]
MDAAAALDPPVVWASATASPSPLTDDAPRDPLEREARARCGEGEAGLRAAASLVLARALLGLPLPDAETLAFAQRAAGEPHPWARAWAASAKTLAPDVTLRRLDDWLLEDHAPGTRRCAVASGTGADGTRALAVVTVEALADLAPLPTRARTGQWLAVQARLRVGGTPVQTVGGTLIVLAPNGATRRVPAWLDGTTLRARFALDRPGEFVVQVMASTASGPRPVAEARVFADVEPPAHAPEQTAPGEDAADPRASDDAGLAAMLAGAREVAGEPGLTRDAKLDAIARDHARQVAFAQSVAHDAGDGDPSERLQSAGIGARVLGENVAHAPTVTLAHRELWASPSHRANMLRRDFDRVGVAVVRDAHGEAWVVESFTGGTR